MPTAPGELRGVGLLVKLVSAVSGVVRAVHHLDEIDAMPSVARVKLEAGAAGEYVQTTCDLNSCAGDVLLPVAAAAAAAAW